jgi:hypothetical protein
VAVKAERHPKFVTVTKTVRPEPVEGLHFFSTDAKKSKASTSSARTGEEGPRSIKRALR